MNLKFKVWCHNKNEWETDTCFLGSKGILFHINRVGGVVPLKPDTHTASFFIGVDCNRKEIYSKDILILRNPEKQIQKMELICTIIFLHYQWYLVAQKINIWEHYRIDPPTKNHLIPLANIVGSKQIQRIGNIFEHSDLLI